MMRKFNRIDTLFHLVAIPVFILLTVFLIKADDEQDYLDFWRLAEPAIWVVFIWISNRSMIRWIRARFPDENKLFPRLFYQLALALLIGALASGGSIVFHATVVEPAKTLYECYVWSKKLILTIIVYSLLENIIYEAFYLFISLSRSVIQAEAYKKESLEARFQNLKNQLNPHFLFNSFNTLSTVIEEDPDRAVVFVEELSRLYRYVLNSQKNDWVPVSEEVAMIRSFVFLQQQRHEENLKVDWDLDEQLMQWWIPPLALQVTVENAIKHNEISAERPLKVRLYTENEHLVVENPIQKKQKLDDSNGIGLSNLKNRYNYLAGKPVDIEHSEKIFRVRLPLLKLVKG